MISSQDTGALDALEELIRQVGTPRKDYRQFTLKYMSAYTAKLNLEDYFKEDKKDSASTSRRSWFSEPPAAEPKQANRLSKRKQMKFVEDTGTNTLLVVGGTAEQLANVEELITIWDVPPPKDSESARITNLVPIRYSKAQTVAETIKEVYRDLLSSTDKALQGADAGRPQAQNTYIFGDTGGGTSERRTKVTFKGKLSIGVDDVSNTLIVSTEGQNLMENVQKMIESLDVAAIPTTDVQVVTLKGGMNPDSVRDALAKILGQTSSTSSSGMQATGGMSGAGRRGGGAGGAAGGGGRGGGGTGGGGTGGGGTGGSGRGGGGGTGGGRGGGGGGRGGGGGGGR
ncbi:MAG: hypothetical protein NTY19_11165 [Planctomycetota bacterium]|nr:hypothetical protein [Planctomycetota bacterium]